MDEDADSDPEMEAFADKEIRKEMLRLQSGAGAVAADDDSAGDVSYTDSDNEKD